MSTAHRILSDLFYKPRVIPDPGNGGTITVDRDLAICEMVSTGAETRTLAAPTKSGIQFVLRMLTDGGDIVVTTPNGFLDNVLRTKATFDDAGDILNLISVETSTTGTYRWQIVTRNIVLKA